MKRLHLDNQHSHSWRLVLPLIALTFVLLSCRSTDDEGLRLSPRPTTASDASPFTPPTTLPSRHTSDLPLVWARSTYPVHYGAELWAADRHGNAQRLLVGPQTLPDGSFLWGANSPQWSPSGRWLAFVGDVKPSDDPAAFSQPQLFKVDLDGLNLTQLTHESQMSYTFEWSPDETRIAFKAGDFAKESIVIIDADGSKRQEFEAPLIPGRPRWSADSQSIFLTGSTGNDPEAYRTGYPSEVFRLDTASGGLEQVTHTDGRAGYLSLSSTAPVMSFSIAGQSTTFARTDGTPIFTSVIQSPIWWSPDGTEIAYSGNGGLCIATVSNSGVTGPNCTQLVEAPSSAAGIAWSDDGKYLAIQGHNDRPNLHLGDAIEVVVIDADLTNVTRITDNDVPDLDVTW